MNGKAATVMHAMPVLVVLLGACTASHEPARACEPFAMELCRPDEACRATFEGDSVCMQACDPIASRFCPDGSACLNRTPGPPAVCWIGGPVAHGEPCDRSSDCARGLLCNRDGVCEQACDREDVLACSTPGLACGYSVCETPVPAGSPCNRGADCDPFYECDAATLFTCQPRCPPGDVCPDGTACRTGERCPVQGELPRLDNCERTPEGSPGCAEDEVCAMTAVGVRRCMRTGCRPDGSGTLCHSPCLPDPEDPSVDVCWLGGLVPFGDACSSQYECEIGAACSAAGICSSVCTTEGERCRGGDLVCRDFVCTPEGP